MDDNDDDDVDEHSNDHSHDGGDRSTYGEKEIDGEGLPYSKNGDGNCLLGEFHFCRYHPHEDCR